jgi:hypothetical protein
MYASAYDDVSMYISAYAHWYVNISAHADYALYAWYMADSMYAYISIC